MRILFISNTTSGGGAPASLYNLISGLNGRHEVAVVLPEKSGILYSRLTELGVRCYADIPYVLDVWPKVFRPSKIIRRYYGLFRNRKAVPDYIKRIIDEFRPDVVHTNVGPLQIGYNAAKACGIPHVWHHREYQTLDFGLRFFPSEKSFRKMIMTDGNYNIAITSDIFRHWNLREGVDAVIYNAVSGVSEDSVVERKPYFLYAARIEPSKDLMILLKAFQQYRKAGGGYELYVAGRPCGFYAYRCRRFVRRNGLLPYVHFLGHSQKVPGMMREAAAFIMSSKSEGFGLTTVEAMLSRCLVIGRDTAGTKEQFDRGYDISGKEIGLRFCSVEELAECLSVAENKSDSEEIGTMRDAAFNVASTCYTIGRYVSEVEKFYSRVLKETLPQKD